MDNFIKPIIYSFPVWENNVWHEIQKKNYNTAGEKLRAVLETFNEEEWDKVFWSSLIQGIPAVRGNLSLEDWQEHMVFVLAAVIINLASGQELAKIYSGLELNDLINFHRAIIAVIPKDTVQEKIEVVKKENNSVYVFFTASPIQALGLNFIEPPKSLTLVSQAVIQKKLYLLKPTLRSLLFSYKTADTVFRISQLSYLSEEKTSFLARLLGNIFLEIGHFDDLKKEIQKVLFIEDNAASLLVQSLKEKFGAVEAKTEENYFFSEQGFSEQRVGPTDAFFTGSQDNKEDLISTLTNLSIKQGETERQKTTRNIEGIIKEQTPEEKKQPDESLKTAKENEPAPFILYKESKIAEPVQKKTFSRGFSLPIGFFNKQKSEEDETEPARARVDAADSRIFDFFTKTKEPEKVVNYGGAPGPFFSKEKKADIFNQSSFEELKEGVSKDEKPASLPKKPRGNPFSFPANSLGTEEDKETNNNKMEMRPKLDGNTVILNRS